jgi:pimeloyl-ACP methyl ester carboxylesterase
VARPRDTARVVERPGPWKHRHVAANGARFHVAVSSPADVADPPLVLLLHGFPEFWWAWRHQLPALAGAGYRAVAMDLRGYGGSDKTPRGYDPLTLARDVVGVVKALGERRAVVVGHGWGGYVGWVAATLHPKEISALCPVAAPHPRTMLRTMRRPGGAKAAGHVLAMQLPMVPERRLAKPESGYLVGHVKGWSGPESEFPDNATLATYQDAIRRAPLRPPDAAACAAAGLPGPRRRRPGPAPAGARRLPRRGGRPGRGARDARRRPLPARGAARGVHRPAARLAGTDRPAPSAPDGPLSVVRRSRRCSRRGSR